MKNMQNIKTIYQWTQNTPKMSYNIPNGLKIYQHFPFQGTPKFTQIVFLVPMKIYHLATLE
jgi:hypothetical protein